jgi:carboxyl-terminal processing protease
MKSFKYNVISMRLSIIMLSFFIMSCEKDQTDGPDNSKNIAVSQWIYDSMSEVYFWNSTFPGNINIAQKTDPKAFFNELVYEQEDKWSYITDDYEALNADLTGSPVSMGYSPAFYLLGSTDKVFIIVEYVYPGSPAKAAGLKRGDIILTIDGAYMDTTNYYDLYSETSYTAGLATYSNNTLSISGQTISMTANGFDADPMIYDTIYEISGTKIGYMVYTGFIAGTNSIYLETLGSVFDNFKVNNVTELIVDLRYNPGGLMNASAYLASLIAPAGIVNSSALFATCNFNDLIQSYFEDTEGPESEHLIYRFAANSHNINLPHVYFLTTSNTASASELLMVGLEPYMEVTIVGEPTYGKYTGSWFIYDFNEPRQHNWAMLPIVLKYANSEGYTDFIDGLTPDYAITDNLIEARPFGNTGDPMLAYALENISGTTLKSTISKAGKGIPFKRFDSRLDRIKRNLIVPHVVK